MENKLFELAARRRSVRKYTNEHIDEAVIDEIMKVALDGLSEYSDNKSYPQPFVIRIFCPEHLKILTFLRKSFG